MRPPTPSAYVPLTRRFGSEHERELRETRALYERVAAHQARFGVSKAMLTMQAIDAALELPDDIRFAFYCVADHLIEVEEQIWTLPEPDFGRMSLQAFVEYRNLLYAKEHFFANQTAILAMLGEAIENVVFGIVSLLPDLAAPTPFTVPLVYALSDPRDTIHRIFGTFAQDEYRDAGLFRDLTRQLYINICVASGRDPEREERKPFRFANESTLPLDELVDTYLAYTPFYDLFMTPVPLKLTHEERFHHMHIVGGSGAGKTTLIENLVLHDLQSDDPPSLVIIDPHSDLIRKLTRADLGLGDRQVVIDPRDIHYPPALNVFALNQERLQGYDEVTREQVTAGVIQTFDYLFTGLLGADLTAKQGVFFRYVARLMLTLPEALGRNATILDMLRLMSDPVPYGAAIEKLPPIPRDFFVNDFMGPTFKQTKEQIRYRLQAIIENPTMARLFTSPETKLDLFAELNQGSIILVDTAKDFLKGSSASFGKLFISLTLQAVLERSAIPAHERKPTFLIVDEAASYFDSNIDDLLTEARKYRCGCLFAHQYLDQASGSLRASLNANTAIKFASGLSASDARAMASEMRTTPDFILDQPRLQFAAHIKGSTPHAVSIPISPAPDLPQLNAEEYDEIIARNRSRVAITPAQKNDAAAGTQVETPFEPPDDDISKEW
ncbi:type IV secretory system conjugative DNA transfer family protein [Sphingomonas sp.]|uniref:type IV secretory system conjugative DNA transfer family protein n=1 Tax=Sphingomonas sp. TaxID=28214 RepID=UPI003BA9D7F4